MSPSFSDDINKGIGNGCSLVMILKNIDLGRIVRKQVNVNPGLKVNQGNNFS